MASQDDVEKQLTCQPLSYGSAATVIQQPHKTTDAADAVVILQLLLLLLPLLLLPMPLL